MRGDVGEKTLERRALLGPAGIAGVIIELRQNDPALMPLTSNERLAGLALRVEGVELLFEPFFRGLAGVDGAADLLPPTRFEDASRLDLRDKPRAGPLASASGSMDEEPCWRGLRIQSLHAL